MFDAIKNLTDNAALIDALLLVIALVAGKLGYDNALKSVKSIGSDINAKIDEKQAAANAKIDSVQSVVAELGKQIKD